MQEIKEFTQEYEQVKSILRTIQKSFSGQEHSIRPEAVIKVNISETIGKINIFKGYGKNIFDFVGGRIATDCMEEILVNPYFVIKLVEGIKEQYSISRYKVNENSLEINFVPTAESNRFNTSCNFIGVIFENTTKNKGTSDISWIHDVLWAFYSKDIKQTPDYSQAHDEYFETEKEKYLQSLDRNNLLDMIGLCSKEDLVIMLQALPPDSMTPILEKTYKDLEINRRVLKPRAK